jgi:hypothetical protein
MSPSLRTLSGETQKIGRRPLALDAVRRAVLAALVFVDSLVFGSKVQRLLDDTSTADEAEACLAEGRALLADTGARDRLAAFIAEARALEAQLQVVPGLTVG